MYFKGPFSFELAPKVVHIAVILQCVDAHGDRVPLQSNVITEMMFVVDATRPFSSPAKFE